MNTQLNSTSTRKEVTKMKKINLEDKETRWLVSKWEDQILDLIDNRDEFTRGDLQGGVTVLVLKILEAGIKLGSTD